MRRTWQTWKMKTVKCFQRAFCRLTDALFSIGGENMPDIKTTDYTSEYEFRRSAGPKYQTSSLRPVIREHKKKPDDGDRELTKRPTIAPEQRTRQGREKARSGKEYSGNETMDDPIQTVQRYTHYSQDEKKSSTDDWTGSKQGDFRSETNETNIQNGYRKKGSSGRDSKVFATGENRRKHWKRKKKSDRKADQKSGRKSTPKVAKKVTGSMKSTISDMQKSANASWDTGERWDEASSWDFARDGASTAKGIGKGVEEVLRLIVKVIKAVATTTLLPVILIMTCSLFIVITVLWASSDAGGSGRGERIANPTSNKQVIYNGLLETFEGNETAVYGVMCALMAESGCSPTATEATGKWGISAADYTAQVNDGTVSKEEFINSTYNGVQGSRGYGIAQWSTTGRKKALYEFAESWAMEKGETFDIGGIDMQVAHLQETINTSYPSMKEALIKEKNIVAACYLWISTYEKPSEKYSTWQEKAELDVEKFEEDLRAECSVSSTQGIFLWPCPSSNHITSYFGNRTPPKQGASSNHKGIDIGASMGAQVIAAAAGKVTTVSYNSARGYFIVVDHGSGYVTLYQHLSRQDVKVGDMVKAGHQIGAVGETGISTAPHLHFEVHVNGTPVDPLQFFE